MFETKVVDKIKTPVVFIFFLKKSCRLWDNVEIIVQPDRPQMTIQRIRIECWIPKATDTHSEYVILIAFPPKQWLRERASLLRYAYIACLVLTYILDIVRSHIISKPTLLRKLGLFILLGYVENNESRIVEPIAVIRLKLRLEKISLS